MLWLCYGAGPVSRPLLATCLAGRRRNVTGRFVVVLSAAERFLVDIHLFLWVLWIWILIWIFIDIFRSHDLSGWAKALWFLFVLFIPLIGILVYLIARGGSMQERAAQQAQQDDQAARAYIRDAAGEGSSADQLAKLADLRDRGVISAEEFEREKAKVLAA
jgi:Short C-terminal domain/Phospholipase_D-nuclease N-terminal